MSEPRSEPTTPEEDEALENAPVKDSPNEAEPDDDRNP